MFCFMEYTFYIQDFWTTCTCPEKQRVPWIHYIECVFYYSGFLSNLRLPWNFSLYWIYFLLFWSFESPALALKTELPWNFSLYWIYFLHSEFLSNLRFPWKTEGALNLLYWLYIFYYSRFLSNLRLPWKTELPWNFSSPGGAAAPRAPPPRTPMVVVPYKSKRVAYILPASRWNRTSKLLRNWRL